MAATVTDSGSNAAHKGSPIMQGIMNPDALCATHATKYMPKRAADGSLIILARSTATQNRMPRNTVHFCLNHKVESHLYGNWDDAPILVIAPLNAMCDANGAPAVLNTVDTFWSCGINQGVKVPDATIVMPGHVETGIFDLKPGCSFYKTERFSDGDVEAIRAQLNHNQRERFDADLASVSVEDKDKCLAKYANNLAVTRTLEHLGYEVQRGGMWAWDDSFKVTEATNKLAEEIGTICIAHTNTAYAGLEHWASQISGTIEFIHEWKKHPRADLERGSDSRYYLSDTRFSISEHTYLGIVFGTYREDIEKAMSGLIEKADNKTREVYENFFEMILPEVTAGINWVNNRNSLWVDKIQTRNGPESHQRQ